MNAYPIKHCAKHTRPDNGTRAVFWHSWFANGKAVSFRSVPLRGAMEIPTQARSG